MTTDPALMSAMTLIDHYRRGALSPVEALDACLERVERRDGDLKAFCLLDPEGARDAARESERRWREGRPLGLVDGVPATVKDLVMAKGWVTRRGSRTYPERKAPDGEDAPAVARLREHGAVLVGKTTTPEFGHKGVTDSPLTGVTRNPWNLDRTPGGSSGGAAVAAATGMAPLNIGTDGGGSIRIPASFTGIFGHKPSFGRVPSYPASPLASLAHVGPMTRTVADAALMLRVLSEPDIRDWFALPLQGEDFNAGLDEGVKGMRIAYSPTLNGRSVDPEVAATVAGAARRFADLGAEVEEVALTLPGVGEVFQVHWTVGAAALVDTVAEDRRHLLDESMLAAAALGRGVSATDYARAQVARAEIGQRLKAFHRDFDLLVMPTLPLVAFEAGRRNPGTASEDEWVDWTPFTYPFNLSHQPACSIPCGFSRDGLPIGLQIVGRMFDDMSVLRAARAFEREQPIAPAP